MAKKITLTVNETLFSKIDQWRSSFNLSRLFQDAVTEAIKAKEEFHRMLSGKEDIPQIVERLKAEKRGLLENARQEGESNGGAWASRAHYRELIAVVGALEDKASDKITIQGMTTIENQSVEAWQQKRTITGADSPELAEAVQAYRDGWRAGVQGLWEMVKDQLVD